MDKGVESVGIWFLSLNVLNFAAGGREVNDTGQWLLINEHQII